jgi:hypothetical protein
MASEKILGAQPRPRLAVITRDPAQPLFDGIADVAPTVDFFTHTSQFSHLEYDIVISNQPNLVGYDQDSEMVMRETILDGNYGDVVYVYGRIGYERGGAGVRVRVRGTGALPI